MTVSIIVRASAKNANEASSVNENGDVASGKRWKGKVAKRRLIYARLSTEEQVVMLISNVDDKMSYGMKGIEEETVGTWREKSGETLRLMS